MQHIYPPRRSHLLPIALLSFCSLFSLLISACGSTPTSIASSTPTTAHSGGTVQVMYAASLESIMENQVKSTFDQSTGYAFSGEAKGSLALANEIKGRLRRPDVFISASP